MQEAVQTSTHSACQYTTTTRKLGASNLLCIRKSSELQVNIRIHRNNYLKIGRKI